MAAPINISANVQIQNLSQLERQLMQATEGLRKGMAIGNNARSVKALSQPLGRLTGQADEFTKSMDAANARVLAFGASVGVVNAFTNAFKSLIASTIEVEKAIKSITVVGDQFAGSTKELGQGLFNVAKLTGQSFAEVSKAALEFSRQGLKLEDTLQRTKDALILTRLTGLDSAKAVDGLTAAFNAFSKAGISTSQILNKLAAVDQAFAVSSADLIEGFNRSAAVAQNAGISFDELAGIITSLQTQTSRGGAVIGNALKTIFTRIQDKDTLEKLDSLGIAVTDVQNRILPARKILENLANDVEGLGKITQQGIFADVAGTFQINQLISLVGDLNKQNSIAADATKKSAGATNEAYTANEKLNQSLDAILNKVALSGKQIGSILGDLGIADNLKGLLDGLNSFLEYASETLQGDSIGAKFAKGIVKGIGSILTGPGVGLFLAIIGKLSYDLIKFGTQSLKTFFNIGQAAKQQQQIQESIVQTLLRNQNVLSQIVNTQGGQNAQAQAFLNILRQEEQTLQNIRTLAGGIAAPVIAAGYRTGPQGLSRGRSAAAGYLPAQEAADVRRGVGGASPSSKVVAIPNFAFGGGKRGTMIANTSEYIVPNYAGGGSAIFNQDMAKTMGLPPGAKKISAAGGFVPNFSDNTNAQDPKNVSGKYALLVNDLENPRLGQTVSYKPKDGDRVYYKANIYGVQGTKNLTSAEQLNRFRSEFSTEALTAKYEKLALEDIGKYSNAVVGEPISPVAATKLANKGSVPSLVGSIFESAIISALSDADLINAQAERNPNAPFDFALAGKSKQFNKFFGIPQGIDYIEAKYSANSSTIESFASKIDRIESGKYVEKEIKQKGAAKRPFLIRDKKSVLNALGKTRGPSERFNFQIDKDAKISPEDIQALIKAGGIQTNASSGYIPNFAASSPDFDGDGTLSTRDRAYIKLKAAMQKASKNAVVKFAADQVLQNLLGLPEGIDTLELIKSCYLGLKAIDQEEELNKVSRNAAAAKKSAKRQAFLRNRASNGFMPNFASTALQAAISRERSAGVPASQIYIDKSPALQSSANPMGLMVANRRDEPAGGFQGISRARNEGRNPKTYGAAKGFVPNFSTLVPQSILNQNAQANSQSTASGGSGNNTPKSSGDALAKVFALQSALVGLTAVFEETAGEGSSLTEGFKKVGGVVTGILSGATLLSAGLGPLGIALAALTSGFNVVKAVWPNAIQQLSEAFGALSDSGKRASKSLNEFGENAAKGGVTPEEALNKALQKLEQSRLRAQANDKNISLKTGSGEQKTPQELNRDLLVNQTTTAFKDVGIKLSSGKSTGAQREPSFFDYLASGLIAGAGGTGGTTVSTPSAKDIAGIQEFKSLADFNEETKRVIIGSFADTIISLNKTGLITLGKVLNKKDKSFQAKDFKQLVKEQDVSDYRSELLAQIFRGQDVQEIINKAISASTKPNGEFDERAFQAELDKSNISNIAVDLAKAVKDTLPKIEDLSPENQVRIKLDGFLRSFNDFNAEIDRSITATTSLFEGIVGSQAFSALSEQRQSELKTQLDRFKFTTSSQKSERALVSEAQSLAASKAKDLAATEGNPDLLAKLQNLATSTSSIADIQNNFTELATSTSLVGKDLEDFKKELSGLINRTKDFQSSRDTESKLLELSILERENELNSIKSFYQGLDSFNKGIREKEAKIRQIDFQIKSNQQLTNYRKEMIGLTTSSLDEYRSKTRNVENQGFTKEQGLIKEQTDLQAKIELEKALYTQENIKALNRNTEALEAAYKDISTKSLQEELTKVIVGASGRSITPEEGTRIAALSNQIRALNTPASANGSLDNSRNKLTELIQAPNEQVRQNILNSIPNEGERNNFKQIYENYAQALSIASKTLENNNQLQKESNEQEDNLNKVRDSYVSALATEARQIEQSLRSQPMSMGQYLTESRKREIALKEEKMSPEAVRESRSSFRRGFEDSMTEIEAKTADFRNEIGREIPQLFSSNLAQGLSDAISGAKSLKDALRDAATSFLNAITQKNIENLANMFTSGIGNIARSASNQNNNGYASGGLISGGSGAKDDVPAMLMGGEYVIKKSAVKKYGSRFLDSLNNGGVQAFAAGGGVQSGKGGFYVPGDFGEGAITGKNQLLAFAGQSFSSGQYDRMGGFGMGGASVSLEPESARLTAYGRENSPIFERVQQAKEEAFNVYLDQLKQESAYREQLKQMEEAEKARKKQLQTAIISAVVSSAVSYAGSAMAAGGSNALGAANQAATASGKTLSLGSKFTTYLGGALGKGGVTGTGGLGNVLSGNFSNAITNYNSLAKANGIGNPQYFSNNGRYGGVYYGTKALPVGEGFTNSYNPLLPNVGWRATPLASYQRASGGLISGGSGMRDDVPAMLTGGEFVLNNRATRKLGVQNLNRLNSGATESQQSSGGVSDALISKLDELIQTTRESSKDNVVVNVSGMEAGGEKRSDENKSSNDRELQRKIKEAVLAVIAQEKRLGGSLNK